MTPTSLARLRILNKTCARLLLARFASVAFVIEELCFLKGQPESKVYNKIGKPVINDY